MTPHRRDRRGSYVVDRIFRGVGRIKRSTGGANRALARQLDAMLTTLWQAGRVDILRAIKDGTLTLLEVWSRYRVAELDRLPTVETLKPLRSAFQHWLRHFETGEHNLAHRRAAVRAMLALAPKDAGVQMLPDLLRRYETGPAMFNRTRGCLLAFVRDTLGKRHKLHDLVADVPARKEVRAPRPKLSVAEVRTLADQMAPYQGEVWSLATTGMRTDREYFSGHWERTADGIAVRKSKTASGIRAVPDLGYCTAPTVGYVHFQRLMRKATGSRVRPYDLRGTYGSWLENVGIPRGRVIAYMGHANRSVTDLYTRDESGRHLTEDAARLRAYLGEPPTPGLRVIA